MLTVLQLLTLVLLCRKPYFFSQPQSALHSKLNYERVHNSKYLGKKHLECVQYNHLRFVIDKSTQRSIETT